MSSTNSSSTKKVHRSVLSLKLPTPAPQLVTYVQGILNALTGNPTFPTPNPPLATIASAVSDLQTAETAASTRAKGTIATRNEKRAALVSLLDMLGAYVQSVADATPENAPSIIESAGLAVRKTPVRVPRVFSVKQGTVSGEVKIVASSAGPRASYEWEYSLDGGTTWLAIPPTIQAKTSVAGLKPGSSVMFKYRSVTKTGASDWSQPITMPLVK